MHVIIFILAYVFTSILVYHFSVSISHIIIPLANIPISILICHFSVSIFHIIIPLANIFISIIFITSTICLFSKPFFFIVSKLSHIYRTTKLSSKINIHPIPLPIFSIFFKSSLVVVSWCRMSCIPRFKLFCNLPFIILSNTIHLSIQ